MDPPIHVYVAILVRKRIILIMVYLHVSASYTNLKVIDSSSQNLLNHAFASHSILEFVALHIAVVAPTYMKLNNMNQ